MITVLLADDEPLALEELQGLIQEHSNYKIVGTAGAGDELHRRRFVHRCRGGAREHRHRRVDVGTARSRVSQRRDVDGGGAVPRRACAQRAVCVGRHHVS